MKVKDFIDKNLIVPITVLALPALIFAVLFQTECFALVSAASCLIAVMIGLVLAVWLMHYILQLVDSENLGKRLRESEVKKLVRSMAVCTLMLLALSFLATNVASFMIGVGGCFLTESTLIYYLVWRKLREKKKENEN